MTTYYVDPINGSDANNGLAWGTAKKTLSAGVNQTFLGTTTGHTIRIAKSPDPVNIGSVTWTNNSPTITFTGCSNITIDNCDSGWTAGLVTPTYVTAQVRQGTNSMQTVLSSTNGKVCYKAFTTADYSAFSRITFWVNFGTAVNYTASNPIFVDLCSDNAGATPVSSFNLPKYYFPANYWVPITVDLGTAIGSSIQSIAIRTTSAVTNTIRWDNISIAKGVSDATSLTLTDLIAKNDGKGEYYPPMYIDGTTIGIAACVSSRATKDEGFVYLHDNGTESVTSIKRTCFDMALVTPATAAGTKIADLGYVDSINQTGIMTYIGGVNTSNDTVDGETWFDSVTGYGVLFSQIYTAASNFSLSNLSAVRGTVGIQYYNGDNGGITNMSCVNNIQSYQLTPTQSGLTKPAAAFNSGFKYILAGSGNTGPSISTTGAYFGQVAVWPQYRPSISCDNGRSHGSSLIAMVFPCDFTSTGTLWCSVTSSSGATVVQLPSVGIININNIRNYTPSAFFSSSIFGCTSNIAKPSINNNTAPSVVINLTGSIKPPTGPTLTNANFLMFSGLDTAVNPSILLDGTASSTATIDVVGGASFGLFTLSSSSRGISGNITIKNVLSSQAMPKITDGSFRSCVYRAQIVGWNKVSTANRILSGSSYRDGTGNDLYYWENQSTVTYTGTSALRKAWTGTNLSNMYYIHDAFELSEFAVKGGSQVTISIRCRRDSTDVTGYVYFYGGYCGLPTYAYAETTGSANTWELLQLTFTPTENAVIDLFIGGSVFTGTGAKNVYFDDIQITQA